MRSSSKMPLAMVVSLALVAGCAMISGLEDFQVTLGADPPEAGVPETAPPPPPEEDASSADGGVESGAVDSGPPGFCTVAADCADASTTTACCNNTCVDTATDPLNCGVCAKACSKNHVPTPACAAGACTGACETGYANCSGDKGKDGCDTNIFGDPLHCGGCTGKVCSSAHVPSPTCANGTCNGTCESGFADCNTNKSSDGCEGVSDGTCAHSVTSQGGRLSRTCSPCVQKICDNDHYCCDTEWDNRCVNAVDSRCGASTACK
jgi:hypothetical protein